ncbi:hypothetical protein JOE38_002013 [Clavibacter michiganensis]|uniref:hypothetical protein n=1 Tax=Clavibacter michiganensis TaxID=28447 RepID=UPI001956D748|nr:hypothetical protein [Clavibacter michiganensis]MBM7412190.1 hypothetical protein [Clavibacter michiganensis]
MLGYDAQVLELRPGVSEQDLLRIAQIPSEERSGYLSTLVTTTAAYVPYRTWVDELLTAAEDGRALMLLGGGYPYLFYASGADIKANFAAASVEAISALHEETWYIVKAWDQS